MKHFVFMKTFVFYFHEYGIKASRVPDKRRWLAGLCFGALGNLSADLGTYPRKSWEASWAFGVRYAAWRIERTQFKSAPNIDPVRELISGNWIHLNVQREKSLIYLSRVQAGITSAERVINTIRTLKSNSRVFSSLFRDESSDVGSDVEDSWSVVNVFSERDLYEQILSSFYSCFKILVTCMI